jgi:alkylation response protein AidB-like acyl-CoA dehydrogenase
MLARNPNKAATYLDALRALAPLVAEHRASFDRDRRLPTTIFNELADAGFFRLWLPEALGGPALHPNDFMTVVETASALDGSVGWLVGNGAGMSRVGGYLPEAAARDVFADPRAFIASGTGAVGTAIRTNGGYRITGRWPFGSGAHHATHFMGLASVKAEGEDEPPPLSCYFARRDVVVHDTWHVSGLRATGSCDFEVTDAFVPDSRTHGFLSHVPMQDGAVYAMPIISSFAWTVATTPLGMARGAMDAFAALAARKARGGTSAALRDREVVQHAFGRALVLHEAGRALLREAMAELILSMSQGGARLVQARAGLRAASTHAAESAIKIADILSTESGASSIVESIPLERFVRDIHAAGKHIAMGSNNHTVLGQLGLGLEPSTKRF